MVPPYLDSEAIISSKNGRFTRLWEQQLYQLEL